MTNGPQRRPLKFNSLEQVLDEAEHIAATGEVNSSGTWTAAQNIDHVARVIDASVKGFDFTAPLHFRIVARLMKKKFLTGPFKAGIKIPPAATQAFVPDDGVSIDDAIARLRDAVRLASQPGAMSQASPIFGPMSEADWVNLHCRHAELHFGHLFPTPETQPTVVQ